MDQFFIQVNTWLTSGGLVAPVGALLWGMISVLLSPCHIGSIPLIIAYVGGQDDLTASTQGSKFAVLFSLGLFITIGLVGLICALLGRMLGDVGPYWTILIGGILIWVAIDMLGLSRCTLPSGMLRRLKIKGGLGAFVLGLSYGVLSGSCTFGFIAPILAMITVQDKITSGLVLITLFGIGHCIPIAIAGSSTVAVKKLLANSAFSTGVARLKQGAGLVIGGLGLYFISKPFI